MCTDQSNAAIIYTEREINQGTGVSVYTLEDIDRFKKYQSVYEFCAL